MRDGAPGQLRPRGGKQALGEPTLGFAPKGSITARRCPGQGIPQSHTAQQTSREIYWEGEKKKTASAQVKNNKAMNEQDTGLL